MKTRICIFLITLVFMLSLAVTSSAEKLFWVDCGHEFDCTNAKVYYVDPSSSTPKAVLFDTGVFVYAYNETSVSGEIPSIDYSFLSGDLDLVTYQQSDTGDDICRAVKVGMTSTTPPINIPNKSIQEILLDGRYIVKNYSSMEVQICSTDLSSCKPITPFTDSVDHENFNKQWIILRVDCKLISYDYINEVLHILYPQPPDPLPIGECVDSDGKLHKDGYVYFQTKRDASPFTNTIKKVPVNGGSVEILTEFTTDKELDGFDLDEISSTHVVYSWRTSKYSEDHVRSIPKGGGTPDDIVVINDACVEGGIAGQYYFCEDKYGNVWRATLAGTQRIKRSNSQINGATYGGSADWFYGINPSTGRVLLSDISNNLKSYAINEDFRDATKGILIGTVPVNLSNFNTFSEFGLDMLGFALKRSTAFSFGTDILFLDATSPSSLKRLTNSNGWKITYTSD